MIREHDRVVLTSDIPDEELVAGDVGTVVHIYHEGKGEDPIAFEVEFFTLAGKTATVATILAGAVRPVSQADRLHVRVAA